MSAGIALYATVLAITAANGWGANLKLCAGVPGDEQRLACFDDLARRASDPADSAPGGVKSFGLPPAQSEKTREPDHIRSRLVGEFQGWESGVLFRLENGQVWKCISDDRTFYSDVAANPEIVITKSYFGAYWMEITPIGRQVKVRRVK